MRLISRLGWADNSPPRPGAIASAWEANSGCLPLWTGASPEVPLPEPLSLPGILIPSIFTRPGVGSKRIGVFSIPQGRVFGPSLMVSSRKGNLLQEFSLEWGCSLPESWIFRHRQLPPEKRLPGRTLLLACTGGETFYHFLAEAAGKLALLAKAAQNPQSFQHILVNDLRPPYVRAVLEACGIDLSRCRETRERCHYICEDLTAPTLPGEMGSPHQDLIDFYRRIFPSANSGRPGKKIWIRRLGRKQRCVVNESELLPLLEANGIQALQLESVPMHAQIHLFQEASLVLGIHGAGLTNLIFSHPGGTLVELFPEDEVNQCYRVLAAAAGWSYAPWVHPRPANLFLRSQAQGSIWVDPHQLGQVLRKVSPKT